jgi:hypothetical protein
MRPNAGAKEEPEARAAATIPPRRSLGSLHHQVPSSIRITAGLSGVAFDTPEKPL